MGINNTELDVIVTIDGVDYTEYIKSIGKITSVDADKSINATNEISVTMNDPDQVIYNKMLAGTLYDKIIKIDKNDETNIFTGRVFTPVTWDDVDFTVTFTAIDRIQNDTVTVLTDEEMDSDTSPYEFVPIVFGIVLGLAAAPTNPILNSMILEDVCQQSVGKNSDGGVIITNKATFQVSNPQDYPSGNMTIILDNTLFSGSIIGSNFVVPTSTNFNIGYPLTCNVQARLSIDDDSDATNPSVIWVSNAIGGLEGKYLSVKVVQDTYVKSDGSEGDATDYDEHVISYYKNYIKCTGHDDNKLMLEFPVKAEVGSSIFAGSSDSITAVHGKYKLDDWGGKIHNGYAPSWVIRAGEKVRIFNTLSYYFRISGVETSEVFGIYAYYDGKLQLLNTGMYTLYNCGGSTETSTEFDGAFFKISSYLMYSSHWKYGEYFVAMRSTIAPDGNVCDVVKYIIEGFTDATIDIDTFNNVKSRDHIKNYPCGFAIQSEEQALHWLQKICWEANIKIVIQNKIAYIYDMTEDFTTYDVSVDSNNSENDTLSVSVNSLDILYTRIKATYKTDLFSETPVSRYSKKSGMDYDEFTLDYEYLIYNIRQCVIKSVLFWIERYGHLWLNTGFNTFDQNNVYHSYDKAELDLPNLTATKGIITKNTYDITGQMSEFNLWLPVSPDGGTPFQTFSDAFPADIIGELTNSSTPLTIGRSAFYDYSSLGLLSDRSVNDDSDTMGKNQALTYTILGIVTAISGKYMEVDIVSRDGVTTRDLDKIPYANVKENHLTGIPTYGRRYHVNQRVTLTYSKEFKANV